MRSVSEPDQRAGEPPAGANGGITMAHAGTITGGSAQTKQNGSLWLAIGLAVVVAVVVATAAVRLGSNASPTRGVAVPVADRSYDRIQAAGGAVTVSNDSYDSYLNGILDRAHAAPYVTATAPSMDAYLNYIANRAHAKPSVTAPAAPASSSTSGTFHPGGPQPAAPAKRDRIGGE